MSGSLLTPSIKYLLYHIREIVEALDSCCPKSSKKGPCLQLDAAVAEVELESFCSLLTLPVFPLISLLTTNYTYLSILLLAKFPVFLSKGVIPSVSPTQELLNLNTHVAGVYNLWLTIAINSA